MYLNHRFYSCYCGIDLINILAHESYSMLSNRILNHISKYHSFISTPMPIYSYSPVLNYSFYKWVNWVIQYSTYPCPISKCNSYYLWVIVVTLIQYYCCLFDTYVVQFTWVILNSIHALVKHKEFIIYILDSPILSNHFDLPSKVSNSYLAIHNPFAISLLSQYLK
jgi:hypothetical protein